MGELWFRRIVIGVFLTVGASHCGHALSQEKAKPPQIRIHNGTREDAENALKVANRFFELEKDRKIEDALKLVEEAYRDRFRKFMTTSPVKSTKIDYIGIQTEKRLGKDHNGKSIDVPILRAYMDVTRDYADGVRLPGQSITREAWRIELFDGKWWITVIGEGSP